MSDPAIRIAGVQRLITSCRGGKIKASRTSSDKNISSVVQLNGMGCIRATPTQHRAPDDLRQRVIQFHHHRISGSSLIKRIKTVDYRKVGRGRNCADKNISLLVRDHVSPQLVPIVFYQEATTRIETIVGASTNKRTGHQLASVRADPGHKNIRAIIITEHIILERSSIKRPIDNTVRRWKIE